MKAARRAARHPAVVWAAGGGLGLSILAEWEIARQASGTGSLLGRFSQGWLIGLALASIPLGVAAAICLLAIWRPRSFSRIRFGPVTRWLGERLWARILLAIASATLLPWAFLGTPAGSWEIPWARLWLTLLAAGVFSLAIGRSSEGRLGTFALAVLSVATVFVFARRFLAVTDYPFALSWSEGNRLWDYSLYFGHPGSIFPASVPLPSYLAPGRHGLWGLPFLIPGVPIQVLRTWDAALWTLPYLLLGLVVWRKVPGLSGRIGWGLCLWVFLFLSQGPIYAPLVLAAVILLWFFDPVRPLRTAAAAALAAFYAGMSRWTWAVAPAAWAGLAAVSARVPKIPEPRRFLRAAALGLAGLIGALASQLAMAALQPSADPIFATALRQPLLWYRLLPSPTNALGIIPGLLLVIGPLGLCLAWAIRNRVLRIPTLVGIGLATVALGFLAVGLAASVKIGGGSNLHNLDMLLVTLALLPALLPGAAAALAALVRRFPVGLAAVLLVPVFHAVAVGSRPELPAQGEVQDALRTIQTLTAQEPEDGEVLFIDQRQLFAFGRLAGVPLVMDYELKDLMNQALANYRPYLDRFEADLARHRFRLIVVDPLSTTLQGRGHEFGEENDAWARQVAGPLLAYYEPVLELKDIGVWILAPIRSP